VREVMPHPDPPRKHPSGFSRENPATHENQTPQIFAREFHAHESGKRSGRFRSIRGNSRDSRARLDWVASFRGWRDFRGKPPH